MGEAHGLVEGWMITIYSILSISFFTLFFGRLVLGKAAGELAQSPLLGLHAKLPLCVPVPLQPHLGICLGAVSDLPAGWEQGYW